MKSQGLVKNPDALLAAHKSFEALKPQMLNGSHLRQQLHSNPKAACGGRGSQASVCSSNPDASSGADTEALTFWATVPPVFDQRNPRHTGGVDAVSRPLDQGKCSTCASFAVASAAETAIALTLRRNATHMISIQVSTAGVQHV